MVRTGGVLFAVCATALLASCGSDTTTSTQATSISRGTLIQDPPLRLASVDAATFASELSATSSGPQLLELAGTPTCGVDFYYIEYWTVGANGAPTTASGALMVPTGSSPQCSGPRPIVLYAHGTQTDKSFNIADITNTSNTEGALIAAVFAAQGYIVVAPNYAGYDISTLPYHPFLNGDQQSKDMMDALAAGRTALPHTFTPATSDNGQLFLTGYSEGGYVAMATLKAMTAAGDTVTASAPMSGPYALEAFGDAVFYGEVNIDSTIFAPLIITSYEAAYGNIYSQLGDVYAPQYANNLLDLLPSTTPIDTIIANGELPETALFSSTPPTVPTSVPGYMQLDAALAVPTNPLFALGFGSPGLITDDYRLDYVLDAAANPDGAVPTPEPGLPLATNPQQSLRVAFKLNDMRNGDWAPSSPVLMCGGDQDPTVFFSVNTLTMQSYWSALPAGLITVLDVNAPPTAGDPFAPLQVAFQQTLAGLLASSGQTAVYENYHTTVAPFCTVAARAFFANF
ncbi:MAG TPA: prolyl oligopeptidase family serine peptidase [Steroidobacteraceae bacterium]|nr:prolyl oligopeptidase family serine peptidase [Steroidobacteraceae bacterium]